MKNYHSTPPPTTGFVRLHQILGPCGPIPVSRSTWYAGVKTGRFPKPVALGSRAVGYRVEEIRELIDRFCVEAKRQDTVIDAKGGSL
jgi:prophage regulatory protein